MAKIRRAWELFRTRLLWGARFQKLGRRATLGRSRLVRNPGTISIGEYTSIQEGWVLADLEPTMTGDGPKIRIGSYCSIQHDFQCNARLSVEIQDYVLMAPRVFITDSDHVVGVEHTTLCREFKSAPVIIEHDCWVGVNAVIVKGVRVGHHSIVGANTVVTRSVPPHSVVVGSPGRVLTRNSAEAQKVRKAVVAQ